MKAVILEAASFQEINMVSLSFTSLLLALWLSWATLSDARLKRYRMKLTWEIGAPNGVAREMIKINGGFPGPNLIVDQGDDIEVRPHAQPFLNWHENIN